MPVSKAVPIDERVMEQLEYFRAQAAIIAEQATEDLEKLKRMESVTVAMLAAANGLVGDVTLDFASCTLTGNTAEEPA